MLHNADEQDVSIQMCCTLAAMQNLVRAQRVVGYTVGAPVPEVPTILPFKYSACP